MRNEVIKFKDVKTLEQLNILSDRWYNRAEWLKSIIHNKEETKERRGKAFVVWLPYLRILTQLSSYYISHSLKQSESFEQGGITSQKLKESGFKVHQNEFIITKNTTNENI